MIFDEKNNMALFNILTNKKSNYEVLDMKCGRGLKQNND